MAKKVFIDFSKQIIRKIFENDEGKKGDEYHPPKRKRPFTCKNAKNRIKISEKTEKKGENEKKDCQQYFL